MGLGLRKLSFGGVALVVCAVLVGGCGGDEDGTTDTTTAESGGSSQSAERREEAKDGAQEGGNSSGRPTGSAPTSSEPLPNEGTKEVAPGVPTTRGGDNSIQEYGTEGQSDERVEASRVLQAYLDALAAREPARACSYVSQSAKRELNKLVERAEAAGQEGEDIEVPTCADIVGQIVRATPKKDLRSQADIRVRSMRIEDERAFLVYEDGGGKATQIAMVEEDGEWKLAVFTANPLIPSAGASS